MAEQGAANSLVAELLAGGRTKANHIVKLLALMANCKQESALKCAVQGLKQFFVAAGQDGQLEGAVEGGSRSAKRQKVETTAAAADGAPADAGATTSTSAVNSACAVSDAESQYREWLGRQYCSFINQLLALATGGCTAPPPPLTSAATSTQQQQTTPSGVRSGGVQVLAAAAVMECVRSELGPGCFSGSLYGRLLSGVLTAPGVRPEVFALLFTKYLGLADVRFYTLTTVRALVAKHASSATPRTAEEEDDDDDDDEAAAGPSSTAAATGGPAPCGGVRVADLARNALDVLSRVAEELPADPEEWSTWCGATEFNVVAAAADKNESARMRRKRKQQEQQEQGGARQVGLRKVLWANAKSQKRLYGDAWLALLALPLPGDVLRKALVRLPGSVIPHMTRPQLLADFLTHCLNRGGLTGMLALNGIFLLVTRHGLEYPHFFARLYQLLVPEAFASRNRAQFFRLADLFLTSALVPAYTVAAFVKRFARLALVAPPPGAMLAIAFVHNLLRRHPALAVMLHNPAGVAEVEVEADAGAETRPEAGGRRSDAKKGGAQGRRPTTGPGVDVYEEGETDPAKSRAVESSLWEVEALRHHYCPQVSTFCAVLDKDLTDRTKTAEVNLEDLLGGAGTGGAASSYNALIGGELSRKLRFVPIAFYAVGSAPSSLFGGDGDDEDWGGMQLSASC